MNCPRCGQELTDGFLTVTGAPPWVLVRWSTERRTWGPRPVPKDSVVLVGPGVGARPRPASRCEACRTVVLHGD